MNIISTLVLAMTSIGCILFGNEILKLGHDVEYRVMGQVVTGLGGVAAGALISIFLT